MMTLKALLDFLKLEAPQLSIRATKKWGLLDLSTSFHYDELKELGELFVNGVISLEDFLLYSASNTKVSDATFISDFRIVNHNKRHLTKPKELIKAIKTGKLKKGDWLIIDGCLKSGVTHKRGEKSRRKANNPIKLEFRSRTIRCQIQKGRPDK